MGQDMLTIPVGGNSEIVRWPDGMGPLVGKSGSG